PPAGCTASVAPHAGARIETRWSMSSATACMTSLLTRERGSKQLGRGDRSGRDEVAPHAGARIETYRAWGKAVFSTVAPHAGARIETDPIHVATMLTRVAPHAGA